MELRHLRYFLAVAEELNFRKAAERLHVSAPTLTQQIQDLEDNLNVRLLDRSTTRVNLTVAGNEFLKEVRQILLQVTRAQESVKSAARGERGTLQIGTLGSSGYGFMPACLAQFRKSFPRVDVSLMTLEVSEQISALQSGEIQIAFGPTKSQPLPSGLGSLIVIHTEWRVVLPAHHRLAKLKAIALTKLAGEPLVCFSYSSGISPAHLFQRIFSTHKIKPGPLKLVRGLEACLTMVSAGQGVTFVPHIPGLQLMDGLVKRPLVESSEETHIELQAIWRNADTSLHVKNFLDILRKNAVNFTRAGRKGRSPAS